MNFKLMGSVLILSACFAAGAGMALNQMTQAKYLRQLIWTIDYMECELQYRMTPLPELCAAGAEQTGGLVGKLFSMLSQELNSQIFPDAEGCVRAVLSRVSNIPGSISKIFLFMGGTLGRFGLEGQLKGLEETRQECHRRLNMLEKGREIRLRSYQTLGLCAGAALVILFL